MLRRRRRSWRKTHSGCHRGTLHQQNDIEWSNIYVKVCELSGTPRISWQHEIIDSFVISFWHPNGFCSCVMRRDAMHFEEAEGQNHVGWACSRSSCASRTYQQKRHRSAFQPKRFCKSQKPRWNWTLEDFTPWCLYWTVRRIFFNNKSPDGDSSVKLTQLPRVKKRDPQHNEVAFLQIHLKSWYQKKTFRKPSPQWNKKQHEHISKDSYIPENIENQDATATCSYIYIFPLPQQTCSAAMEPGSRVPCRNQNTSKLMDLLQFVLQFLLHQFLRCRDTIRIPVSHPHIKECLSLFLRSLSLGHDTLFKSF